MDDGWAIFDDDPKKLIAGQIAKAARLQIDIGPAVDNLADLFRETQAQLERMPPTPRTFMASHSVPYGRAFRQWNTRGELLVWLNRGQVADLPRRDYGPFDLLISPLAPVGAFGIPVVNA